MIRVHHLVVAVGLMMAHQTHAVIEFVETTDLAGVRSQGPTAGASWGDANNDGHPDIWIGNHSFDAAQPTLFLNDGSGGFIDVSDTVVVPRDADLHGAAWVDFDGDGDQDIFIMAGGGGGDGQSANLLLRNDNGRFAPLADARGLAFPPSRGRTPLWLDANHDAQLDVLLSSMPRPDGQAPSMLLLQGQQGVFEPVHPPLALAPTPRTWWAKSLFYGANLIHYRGQHGFGALGVLDQFAQLADVDADDQVELLAYGTPTYIYDLGPEGLVAKHTLMLGTDSQIADVAIADFDGDAQVDLYFARLREAAPDIDLQSTGALRAHLQGVKGDTVSGLSFVSTAPVWMEIIDLWEITKKLPPVYVGRDRRQPERLRFRLDPSDPSVAGQPLPKQRPEILVGFDQASDTWSIANWGRRINIEVTPIDGHLSQVRQTGFTPHDGAIPDRLARQTTTGFERLNIMDSGTQLKTNCSSVVAEDFDNDMDVDVYLVCAGPTTNVANVLLENDGSGDLRMVKQPFGAEGSELGRGDVVVSADYDQDGFVDLLVTNGRGARPFTDDGPYQLFRNVGNANHWLEVDLQGTVSNGAGIGAIVKVKAGGRWQIRQQGGGIHNFAQNHTRLHFGLGANTVVERIELIWPSGVRQTLDDIATNQILTIVEPDQ